MVSHLFLSQPFFSTLSTLSLPRVLRLSSSFPFYFISTPPLLPFPSPLPSSSSSSSSSSTSSPPPLPSLSSIKACSLLSKHPHGYDLAPIKPHRWLQNLFSMKLEFLPQKNDINTSIVFFNSNLPLETFLRWRSSFSSQKAETKKSNSSSSSPSSSSSSSPSSSSPNSNNPNDKESKERKAEKKDKSENEKKNEKEKDKTKSNEEDSQKKEGPSFYDNPESGLTPNITMFLALTILVFTIVDVLFGEQFGQPLITWQQFYKELLLQDKVDHLEVNRHNELVSIFLKPSASTAPQTSLQRKQQHHHQSFSDESERTHGSEGEEGTQSMPRSFNRTDLIRKRNYDQRELEERHDHLDGERLSTQRSPLRGSRYDRTTGKPVDYYHMTDNHPEDGPALPQQTRQHHSTISSSSSTPKDVSQAAAKSVVFMAVPSLEIFEERLRRVQREEMGLNPSEFVLVTYENYDPTLVRDLVNGLALMAIFGVAIYRYRSAAASAAAKTRATSNKNRKGASSGSKPLSDNAGGMNPFSQLMGFSQAKPRISTESKVKFSDVAGMDSAKQEVVEFVEFLKNPKKFEALGAKVPKGALLTGPPGTGKTLLAKAVAGESQVPFLSIAGSDFVEVFGGVGAARVRSLFEQARQQEPCIIYIDEIDAIGRARSSGNFGNSEREQTLNQLLVEMDGFTKNEGVLILASTNRADILDKALLRPGRFDREINVDLPELMDRRAIFLVHMKPLKMNEDAREEIAKRMAVLTPGFSGAQIANVCNEAALYTARYERRQITLTEFQYALDRVIGGSERRSRRLSTEQRNLVAYHEAGHALVAWMMEHTEPIMKVTIVPHEGSLGFAQYVPSERFLQSKEMLFDRMCMILGGRAAEIVVFKAVTSGAVDDLRKVTKIAYGQVASYGMNGKMSHTTYAFPRPGEFSKRQFSEDTAEMIDSEARKLVLAAQDKAVQTLHDNIEKLHNLSKELFQKETLNYEDVLRILGPRPFTTSPQIPSFAPLKHTPNPQETDIPHRKPPPVTGNEPPEPSPDPAL